MDTDSRVYTFLTAPSTEESKHLPILCQVEKIYSIFSHYFHIFQLLLTKSVYCIAMTSISSMASFLGRQLTSTRDLAGLWSPKNSEYTLLIA